MSIRRFKQHLERETIRFFGELKNSNVYINTEFNTNYHHLKAKQKIINKLNSKIWHLGHRWTMEHCDVCARNDSKYPYHVELVYFSDK